VWHSPHFVMRTFVHFVFRNMRGERVLRRSVGGKIDISKVGGKKMHVLEIEDKGIVGKMALEERQICWEGFREVKGKLICGVPKRSSEDCFKHCRHEGCQFT